MTIALSGRWTDPSSPHTSRLLYRGGSGHAYRVTVVPVKPSFSIGLDSGQVSVPKGGEAAVGVTVSRDGFDGPITLRLADPPAGLEFRPGVIAEGQAVGALTLAAARRDFRAVGSRCGRRGSRTRGPDHHSGEQDHRLRRADNRAVQNGRRRDQGRARLLGHSGPLADEDHDPNRPLRRDSQSSPASPRLPATSILVTQAGSSL